MKVCENYTE